MSLMELFVERTTAIASSRLASIGCCLLVGLSAVHAQINLDREPPGPSSRRTGLAITEILYNPRPVPGLATNLTLEFIEVFNSKPWAEDISGYRIGGTVFYAFPEGTVLGPGAYLVVARVPELVKTKYGITNVVGPWDGAETNRLSIEGGLVQLFNRQGATLLTVDYEDSPPWPEAADGTGHSLVLARPSYGEADYRAWSESDVVGGSPGRADAVPVEPLASVFINEWQNHSDPDDWIELYNHSNSEVDLSGAWLSDDPATNKFRIPNGTIIPARGFRSWSQLQLGFELFAGGETIFFWNSNQTRVIDVIDFRGQSNNITSGRSPDGGPLIYGLAARTQNGPNSGPMRYPVVINEIMFNPISGNTDDEYLEIYNRGNQPANISGWQFVVGINYTFPTNSVTTSMPAGAHWVLAKNPTNLFAIYSNLNTNNTFGPYDGTLANGGERVLLTTADYDNVQNGGTTTIEKLPVPASDVNYGDGGKWGNWSDGLGSSLELIDPEADTQLPSNWADSNDTSESAWTSVEYNGPVGETLGTPINDRLIFFLQGIGECLVDAVEVRVNNGPNLVVNGGFESGLDGWALQGSHDLSTVENEGFEGSKSLHLRAGSRGDNQSNRILSAPLTTPIPVDAQNVSIRAKVRWFRGHPEILLRLHGSATEAYARMSLPRRLGTPGVVNSRRVANAGPAIYDVKHSPILPAAGQPVVVTARASDRQGVASLVVRYRIDPSPNYLEIQMLDNGTGGDAIQNDGIFSATIPAQAAGVMVPFYVEGRDNQNAVGTFPQDVFPPAGLTRCWPSDAMTRECVVRWGEVQMPGDFGTYHLWVSAVNSNRWHIRDTQNNTAMDGTFVYNNSRVIYNALPLFSGSPWHRTNALTGPAGVNRVDYEMNFPDDEPLLGSTDFVLNNPGNADILTISDLSAVAEQTVYRIFEGLGLPFNHRRYVHLFVNGSQRSTAYERPGNFIFEDSQQPNGDMAEQWFGGGDLYKVEDWFEFNANGFDISANNDADLARRTTMIDGQETFLAAPYRFMFRKRSIGVGNSANDYSQIFRLIDAVSPAVNPNGPTMNLETLSNVVDWEAWMRHFAVQRTVGNWDSYGWERGKNDYLCFAGSGVVHMPWDIDYSLGLGKPANEPLFATSDPRVAAMFNTPAILRAYWRAFEDIVNGPFNNATLDAFIDSRTAALSANNVNYDPAAVAAIKAYITARRAYIQGQLATVSAPFAVDGPTTFSTEGNLIELTGTAPIGVKTMTLNGEAYPVTWTSATNFLIRIVVAPGVNSLVLAGVDRFGVALPGTSLPLEITYTGIAPNPVGALVISEIMTSPGNAGAQFVEIVNRSTNSFDLAGWLLEGANFEIPVGSIITNRQTVVLARNRSAFIAAYGNIPVFGVFEANLTSAQTLALVRPGVEGGGSEVVNGVTYEARAPWATVVPGASLQVIDLARDNSRSSNWAVDPTPRATPGAPNSVAASLPSFDPLWLNELQAESMNGPLDNTGEREPWIELLNSGATPLSLDGYYLATAYTSNLTQYPFPSGIVLAPGEHRVLWADGEPAESTGGQLHLPFRLESDGQIALVRLIGGQPQITDYLTWYRLRANVSYGSAPDGQCVYRFDLHAPSAGGTNVEPAPRVFINEWLTRNSLGIRDPADNAQDDWIEIYNAESFPVDLGGYYFSDDEAINTKFRVPSTGRYTIPARGYLLVWADNQTNQNTVARVDLHVNFQLSSSPGVIRLFAPDGITPVDAIGYGQQTADISEGRYADGATNRFFMTWSSPKGRNTIPNYNSPPLLPPLPNLIVVAGQSTGNQVIRGTDPEMRAGDPASQFLTYSVVEGPVGPGGVELNQSGLFRWIVPITQPPGDYRIALRATDNGTPPRSDTASFIISVRPPGSVISVTPPPVIYRVASVNGQATFSVETIVGRTYRVFYCDDLSNPTWVQLGRDFVAGNSYASLTDAGAVSQRFYRVQQLD